VHRVYEFSVTDDGWQISRDVAAGGASAFSQRFTVAFEDDDNTMEGLAKLSYDNETWRDDLQITYRRSQ
jgi:hypothetical protein